MSNNPPTSAQVKERIENVDVTDEMQGSFLEYAYSVIYSRALPDARDGLKPVQRRILYTMDTMGLVPEKGHVKSSRVIGEVMGKYHPHGDSAIYDALVRQAQDFSLRLPLVDGHGNFGSLDDGPAASRYTEARLAPAALAMTDSLHEDTVPFVPNYDNQLEQPEVLPAALPNLLVNGAAGIAVGMATNMPPHNLNEVVAALQCLIEDPQSTLEDIMKHIPGPDFPTGGSISQLSGVKDAYRTGRGSFRIRATATIESISARKQGIIVTELPYMIGPEKVIDKIKEAVNSKKLQGITDVVDLTDRKNGLRLQIEVKAGFNPEAVLEQLYRYTPMEDSFGVNNVALVDGQPKILNLRELLQVYIDHRLTVVTRRTKFRLLKKQGRLHLVEGLLIAISDIDGVIAIIRSSEETAEARERLMSAYSLTQTQADYILELRLRQLTKYSKLELEKERRQLSEEIAGLEAILASPDSLRTLVSTELTEVASHYGTARRTALMEHHVANLATHDISIGSAAQKTKTTELSLEIADDPCWAILDSYGNIGRTKTQRPLKDPLDRRKNDVLRAIIATTARAEIGVVTSRGRMVRVPMVNLPIAQVLDEALSYHDFRALAEFIALKPEETIVTIVPLNESFALGTLNGVVKRVVPDYPQTYDEWEIISLKTGDHVVGAAVAQDTDNLVFVTRNAQLLHYKASSVRPQGRSAGGMVGIRLSASDMVIFFGVVADQDPNAVVITVAAPTGFTKMSSFAEFPPKGRATGGVRAQRLLTNERELRLAWVGRGPARAATNEGDPRRLPQNLAKRDASGTLMPRRFEVVGPSLHTNENRAKA